MLTMPTSPTAWLEPVPTIPSLNVLPAKEYGATSFSDVYIMNTWFFMLMMNLSGGNSYLFWSDLFLEQLDLYVVKLLMIAYIWYEDLPRKPPDKGQLMEFMVDTLDFIGIDLFTPRIAIEVLIDMTISHLVPFICLLRSYINHLDPIIDTLASIYCYISNHHQVRQPHGDPTDIIHHEMNTQKHWRFCHPLTATCNVSVWTASNRKLKDSDGLNIDTDSSNFAVDTCASETICRDRELFVGSITKCHHINIQGLNSKVKATGYGTISFTVLDDSGQLHKMIVNNVLYVPEAPINLLSPKNGHRHLITSVELLKQLLDMKQSWFGEINST